MKAVYFADPMGDHGAEVEAIKMVTSRRRITELEIEICESDPMFEGKNFDVLFFDWGGMVIGCGGIIQSLCREILKHAEEHPSRLYVLASLQTREAMEDAIVEFGEDRPANLILSLNDALPYLAQEM